MPETSTRPAPGLYLTSAAPGAGKTLIAGGLAATLHARGLRVRVAKCFELDCPTHPDEAGSEASRALARLQALAGPPPATLVARTPEASLGHRDAPRLARLAGLDVPLHHITPSRYAGRLPPLDAGRLAGRPLTVEAIAAHLRAAAAGGDLLLVEEGAPLPLPIEDDATGFDVAAAAGLPVLLVAPAHLSALAPALLTLALLRARDLPVAGVVLTHHDDAPLPEQAAVPHHIERLTGIPVHGVLPFIPEDKRDAPALLARRVHVHLDVGAIARAAGLSFPLPPLP